MGSVCESAPAKGMLLYKNPFCNSKIASVCLLLLYLFLGVLFYRFHDNVSWAQAYYFCVNEGLRIGNTVPVTDVDRTGKIFTIGFKILGIAILATLYTNLFRSNFFQTIEVRRNRLNAVFGSLVVFFLFGTIWSYVTVGWTLINSMYYVFSGFWWWGIYAVPVDSSDTQFAVTATLFIVGGLSVFIINGLLASDVEILIEKFLLKTVSFNQFTADELGVIQNLAHQRHVNDSNCNTPRTEGVNKRFSSNQRSVSSENISSKDSINPLQNSTVLDSPARPVYQVYEIDEQMAKHILLGRIIAMEDISIVYYHVRMNLTVGFAALVIVGAIFYTMYDGCDDWGLSFNYSLSAAYRLGYSNVDKDGFSQIVSSLLMLFGTFLFSILNISIVREFSLKTKNIRYFHTWLDGLLCLLLAGLTSIMFVQNYGYTRIDAVAFAVNIMVGYGGDVPSDADELSYWLLDLYTIAAVPLFAAYVSHVEVELDIGDFSGYMDNAIESYFSEDDRKLLAIFDKTFSRTTAFGLYELHVLLILRFREMQNLPDLIRNINEEYSIAIKNGLKPNMSSRQARAVSSEEILTHEEDEHQQEESESQSLLSQYVV